MKGMPDKCTEWHGGWEKDTPSPLKTVLERLGKKISLIPILKQVKYLEISSASLFPFLWLSLRCLSLVNQLWLQTLLTEFSKVLSTVLVGSGSSRHNTQGKSLPLKFFYSAREV